ncbi:MAG: radical SAM/SPASM domain-containing protein, partial [Chloroflexi bacterium]|nr:radical SAM/SPASM domain-containing protein [Chloroflexota bacterium]
ATPLATASALKRAKDAGATALGVSLDGADAVTHDAFRGWQGSFDRTMEILAIGRELGFYLQVNTTITRRNVNQVEAMAELLNDQGIHMWSVFFLVPVGRGVFEQRITPEEYEQVFKILWEQAQTRPYAIKTTEAPHYRRFVLEELRRLPEEKVSPKAVQLAKRLTLGVGDGKGIMFVGHTG